MSPYREESLIWPAVLLALVVALLALLLYDRPVRQLIGSYPVEYLDANSNPFTEARR